MFNYVCMECHNKAFLVLCLHSVDNKSVIIKWMPFILTFMTINNFYDSHNDNNRKPIK